MCIEIIKICVSFLTPLLILIFGLLISKQLEKRKLDVLKEKEWQTKWAELFFTQAIEFNNTVSTIVIMLHRFQGSNNEEWEKPLMKEWEKQLQESIYKLAHIDWHMQNYVQFAVKNKESFMDKEKKLFDALCKLISDRKGNLEAIRQLQFEYNQSASETHNEILTFKINTKRK